jgi:predicted NodU family carbamoyl transferase
VLSAAEKVIVNTDGSLNVSGRPVILYLEDAIDVDFRNEENNKKGGRFNR